MMPVETRKRAEETRTIQEIEMVDLAGWGQRDVWFQTLLVARGPASQVEMTLEKQQLESPINWEQLELEGVHQEQQEVVS